MGSVTTTARGRALWRILHDAAVNTRKRPDSLRWPYTGTDEDLDLAIAGSAAMLARANCAGSLQELAPVVSRPACNCMGSGYGGHPDSGAVCAGCNGSGDGDQPYPCPACGDSGIERIYAGHGNINEEPCSLQCAATVKR